MAVLSKVDARAQARARAAAFAEREEKLLELAEEFLLAQSVIDDAQERMNASIIGMSKLGVVHGEIAERLQIKVGQVNAVVRTLTKSESDANSSKSASS